MNYRFCCYGTYNKNMEQCLLKCPDRDDCEALTETLWEDKMKERERKRLENAKDKQTEILS